MADLQHAYETASQIFATLNSMFDALMQAVRTA